MYSVASGLGFSDDHWQTPAMDTRFVPSILGPVNCKCPPYFILDGKRAKALQPGESVATRMQEFRGLSRLKIETPHLEDSVSSKCGSNLGIQTAKCRIYESCTSSMESSIPVAIEPYMSNDCFE